MLTFLYITVIAAAITAAGLAFWQRTQLKRHQIWIYILLSAVIAVPAVLLAAGRGSAGTQLKVPTPEATQPSPDHGSNKKMDMIMWYDIDHGPKSNDRPEKGWYHLNPQHPGIVEQSGLFRATTPLLGLYDQNRPETARQHLYWIAAIGCNALTCDLTNYSSYRTEGLGFSALKYNRGVYNNMEVLLQTAEQEQNGAYEIPTIYPTVRLSGSNFDGLRMILDDMYTLYTQHKDVWYLFDDSGENREKPFIVIFADWNYLNDEWLSGDIPFTDDRFNIRWSNGGLASGTKADANGRLAIPEQNPFWLFVENVKAEREGYYKTVYKAGANHTAEQMTCWAALWQGWSQNGSMWDSMNQVYDGKTTFKRTLQDVEALSPKALLVNRFNYPLVWKEEPQEGLSLYDSVHIEPNEDFGFEIFDIVMQNLYKLNNRRMEAPPAPEHIPFEGTDVPVQKIEISLKGYPLEYRISTQPDMQGAEWTYLNINEWITLPADALSGINCTVYLQTRNCFGESVISQIEI